MKKLLLSFSPLLLVLVASLVTSRINMMFGTYGQLISTYLLLPAFIISLCIYAYKIYNWYQTMWWLIIIYIIWLLQSIYAFHFTDTYPFLMTSFDGNYEIQFIIYHIIYAIFNINLVAIAIFWHTYKNVNSKIYLWYILISIVSLISWFLVQYYEYFIDYKYIVSSLMLVLSYIYILIAIRNIIPSIIPKK